MMKILLKLSMTLNLKVDKSLLNQIADLIEDHVLRALTHYENLLNIKGIN